MTLRNIGSNAMQWYVRNSSDRALSSSNINITSGITFSGETAIDVTFAGGGSRPWFGVVVAWNGGDIIEIDNVILEKL